MTETPKTLREKVKEGLLSKRLYLAPQEIDQIISLVREETLGEVIKVMEYEHSFDLRAANAEPGGKDKFVQGCVKANENLIRRVKALCTKKDV